jgi:hypothetical protein
MALQVRRILVLLLGASVSGVLALPAQSITAGSLVGTVQTPQGERIPKAAITLEDQRGGTVRELASDRNGVFTLAMVLPGTYSVLVELPGYQPVRLRGVVVASGRTTSVTAELVERPPPITSVTDVFQTGTTTGSAGRIVLERELRTLEFRPEGTDLLRGVSEVVPATDGRDGFGLAAQGLPGGLSRVYADGVPELLMRHPGLPGEPAALTGFQREALSQAQVSGSPLDAEWRGNAGSVLSLITRTGTGRVEFAPSVAAGSARLGGNRALNPADSAGTSFQGGLTLSGPIKRDTALFFLQGGYQSLETPDTDPWPDAGGEALRDAVRQTAASRGGADITPTVFPAVRTWKGGGGLGRLDWRVGRTSSVLFRAGGSAFTERSPRLGHDVGNDAGAELRGRDLSVAAALTTTGVVANELRVGASLARRDWRANGLPETRLVSPGVRFGGNAALPGLFEGQLLSLSDAVQYRTRSHALKGGVSVDYLNYRQEYSHGQAGRYLFADGDRFGSGIGVSYQAVAATAEAKAGAPLLGVFLQDTWEVGSGLSVLVGLRYEAQVLPKGKILRNGEWSALTGIGNDSLPFDRRGIQPRLGFALNPGNTGAWSIQGGVGLYSSGLDLAQFAEAIHHSGTNVRVTRMAGAVTWPGTPTGAGTGATRLTLFGGRRDYREPRTLKSELSLVRSFTNGLVFRLSGGYNHTDYLLRPTDLNRAAFPFGKTQEGRPVWGLLVQQGGLLTVAPGTNRRFRTFDLVSVLDPTGFSDHYEATVALSRPVASHLSFSAEYTYARTRDNLVGALEPDPADRLSPFPGGIDGQDWDTGRSDLDIPHRAAVLLEVSSGGSRSLSLAVRGRYRSGLPFTPGFRSGVDVNGDLGGNNDPAPATSVVNPAGPGVHASCEGTSTAGFAARNSCRESGVGSLDLGISVPIPVGSGRGGQLRLTLDVFNLVASTSGVVDRAALLVDPAGTLSANPGTGAIRVPLVANPAFGTLLRRTGEPRQVRLGLRVEY